MAVAVVTTQIITIAITVDAVADATVDAAAADNKNSKTKSPRAIGDFLLILYFKSKK